MFYHLLRMAFASYISCLMHSWFHNYALCNMHLLLHIHVHPLIHTLYPLLHIPFCNTNLFALYTFFRFTYLLTHTTLDSYALCFTYLFASHTSCLIQLLIYTPFALIPFASHTFCFTYLFASHTSCLIEPLIYLPSASSAFPSFVLRFICSLLSMSFVATLPSFIGPYYIGSPIDPYRSILPPGLHRIIPRRV